MNYEERVVGGWGGGGVGGWGGGMGGWGGGEGGGLQNGSGGGGGGCKTVWGAREILPLQKRAWGNAEERHTKFGPILTHRSLV